MCTGCEGECYREMERRGWAGVEVVKVPCSLCKGSGEGHRAEDRCKTCTGHRVVAKREVNKTSCFCNKSLCFFKMNAPLSLLINHLYAILKLTPGL